MNAPANAEQVPEVFKNLQVQQLEKRIESLEQKLLLFETNFNLPGTLKDKAKQFGRSTYEIIRQFDLRFNQLENFVAKQALLLDCQQKARYEKQREA